MSISPPLQSPISNYGKACTNCSKAKCKCSYIEGKNICERCHRLKKDCEPLVPARKRNVRPNTSSAAAKQQRLEQKLDSLVSLLQAQGNSAEAASVARVVDPGSTTLPYQLPTEGATPATSIVSGQTSGQHDVSTAPTSPLLHGGIIANPSVSSASQEALERFRDESLKYFPFLYLPPHMTASQLAAEFPLLWLSITAISVKSMSQLCSMSEKLQDGILNKIYVQGERNVDILLAALSFVGWFRHQRKQKPFFNMWTQLAASLAIELGLNKPPPGDGAYFCYMSAWPYSKNPTAKRERTMLERRAILSTFLMTSWITASFRKSDTMKWTSHMDECLRILELEPEWDGDKLLTCQVRCQLIAEQIFDSPWSNGILNDGSKPGAPEYFTKALKLQLQEVRAKLGSFDGPTTQQHGHSDLLKLFALNTELTVHEASQEIPITSGKGLIDHRKLEPFYNALYCIKGWIDTFFTLPNLSYMDVTFFMFGQFTHCLVSLYRLSILDDPSWDREFVKQTIDVIQVVERFATNIEGVRDTRPLIMDIDEEDLFTKSAAMMRKLGEAWAGDIAAIGAKSKQKETPIGDIVVPPELMDLDLFDSEWMTDMFLAWDH